MQLVIALLSIDQIDRDYFETLYDDMPSHRIRSYAGGAGP